MGSTSKPAKAAMTIVILTLSSKLLGFFRDVLIAAKFGSGIESDAFFVALTATGLLSGLLINSISTTFIPILSEISSKEGPEGKKYHVLNFINILVLVSLIIMAIAWFFAPFIVKLTAKGFIGDQLNLAILLTRLGLPMILFGALVGSLTGYLNSEQKFFSSAANGIPMNFFYMLYLFTLSTVFGIKGLMVSAVIATSLQFLVQIPEIIKSGLRYKPIFDFKDKYLRKILYLSIPILIGVAINDINAIVDRTLASELVTGSISALDFANKLNGLILGVFISAIATVIFPLLSAESSKNNFTGMKNTMERGVNLILLITIPATVGLIILAKPIVEVSFQRGAFTPKDTIMTMEALIFYSVGLIAASLRVLITKVYYSFQDTKTPMVNGAISVVINVVLNLILVRYMAHGGLALATSIANTITTFFLFYGLKNKFKTLNLNFLNYFKYGIKSGIASGLMGITAYFTYNLLFSYLKFGLMLNNLISLLLAITLGMIIYSISCYILRVEEVTSMVKHLFKK